MTFGTYVDQTMYLNIIGNEATSHLTHESIFVYTIVLHCAYNLIFNIFNLSTGIFLMAIINVNL